jgi:uncharacterized protein YhfF
MGDSKDRDDYWSGRIEELEGWCFGDSTVLADDLVELVVEGRKRATASLFKVYEIVGLRAPVVGEESYIKDSQSRPRCVIRVSEVTLVPFQQVSAEFARDEGEGDLSLEFWRKVHREFFERECLKFMMAFSEHDLVVCERFEVLHIF